MAEISKSSPSHLGLLTRLESNTKNDSTENSDSSPSQ